MTFKSYSTDRLLLIPTQKDDASFFLELVNTPKWLKYIGDRNIHSVEEAEEYIQNKIYPQFKKLGYSNYTLVRKKDKVKIGTCGLFDREGLEGVDIGFALLPEYEKRGYGFEASRKMLDLAKKEFAIKQVLAITSKENVSSQKLLVKLGLKHRGYTTLPNEEEELMLYERKLG